jgi:phospholipid/cholesterol/gamma-HCH transport system ATP-binding protein
MNPMPAPLTLCDVSIAGQFEHLSCQFSAGSTTIVVASGEQGVSALVRLIAGLSRPSAGSVLVDGFDLSGFVSVQLHDYRRQTSVVPVNGGLVSNLKVWENLTLPLTYHTNEVSPEKEDSAIDYLNAFGYNGNLMALPAHLSHHEKRIIGFVRAFLNDPRVIVYCDCFEGVSLPHLSLLVRQAREFHTARADRVSIFLTTSTAIAAELVPDTIIHLQKYAPLI